MKTKRQIMTEAHQIAKTFEGNYSACLSEALKISWENAKNNFTPDFIAIKNSNLSEMTVKDIYENISLGFLKNSAIANEILQTVAERSKGFQKDIANKVLLGENISDKQAWCVAYEYKNVA